MILAKWYFTNEVEQEDGPFLSENDAIEAEKLYGKWLDCKLTTEEEFRLKELYERGA